MESIILLEKFIINGGKRLYGAVKNERAKNSVLPIMAAAILSEGEVTIVDCPHILDVQIMTQILKHLNCKCVWHDDNLSIDSSNIVCKPLPLELTKQLRSSVFMLGAMLSKFRQVDLAYPGGCDIGARAINIHIESLKKLGANCIEESCGVYCSIDKIRGGIISLPFASVGATENIMIFSALSNTQIEILNPAREPEIVDLMNFINAMGGNICGAGTDRIVIRGVKKLHGVRYKPISDRIEFGTFALAVAICGGELEINGCNAKNILPLKEKFSNNACKIILNNDIIHISCNIIRKPFSFSTGPYPMFPTDLQAQAMALNCVADGQSIVIENIFENRFKQVDEFIKMGGKIAVKDRTAIIEGVERLKGANVRAFDLRGGASLVLAGLNAQGVTTVNDIRHIDRGYVDIDKKLRNLGADIRRE